MPKTYDIDGIIVDIINPMLGAGGQGKAEQVALSSDTHIALVAKTTLHSPEAVKRTKALIDRQLPLASPYLAAPIAGNYHIKQGIQHLAPFALGENMENDRDRSFPEYIEICFLICCLWTILEEMGIAHGDIAPSNIIISPDGGLVCLIDFDNCDILDPDIPPPTMAGQDIMYAPEIRLDGQTPNIESDRFAYAVLFSMLIFRHHPTDGQAPLPTDRERLMSSGIWPMRSRLSDPHDIPIETLGRELSSLFDAAFLIDPSSRPHSRSMETVFK